MKISADPTALRNLADFISRSDDPHTATALRWAANDIDRLLARVAELEKGE